MSHVTRNTASPTSGLTTTVVANSSPYSNLATFTSCLIFLPASRLPAYADHVHHLWYNNTKWQDDDLMIATGNLGVASSFGAIAAFYTTPNGQLYAYYVDANTQHVRQLYYDGKSWSDESIGQSFGGVQANADGLSGFAIGNLQYVFYVGPDFHVHMLNYNNSNWSDQDITHAAGGNTASPAPLVVLATSPNNQFHVYYQGLNSPDLYQLYFNGSHWTFEDLTSEIGGAYCYTQWIAGYAVGNEQHLFCPGYDKYSNNRDMLHIFYNNSNWGYEDVTLRSVNGSPLPLHLGGGVAAFSVTGETDAFGIASDSQLNWYAFGKLMGETSGPIFLWVLPPKANMAGWSPSRPRPTISITSTSRPTLTSTSSITQETGGSWKISRAALDTPTQTAGWRDSPSAIINTSFTCRPIEQPGMVRRMPHTFELIRPFVRDANVASITEETRVIDDLKVNSARLVDIIFETEDKCNIAIDEYSADGLRTVGDAINVIATKQGIT